MDEEANINGSEPALISLGGSYEYRREGSKKRVAVIGAGPAGLAALRRVADTGMEVTCFEQGATLGGIWNYSDATGKDETGTPLHYCIYRDLRTNLPKEVMMFPDYPYHELEESYIHSSEVLHYLKSFAQHHQLNKYILYRHRVKRVKPLSKCWSLTAEDLSCKQEKVYVFDSIFVCSGPNITPVYADIVTAKFSGHQIHSKEYRVPETYEDKTILLIGLGPSGLDIAYQLSPVAKKIFISSNKENVKMTFPENIILKSVVKNVENKTIYFVDETSEDVDCIIHCTGYTYNYPFLHTDCGVTINKFVYPLYKHFVNITRPTMYFIGLIRPGNQLFICDYQVRTAVKYLTNEIELPSEEDMKQELEEDITKRRSLGQKPHNFHWLQKEFKVYMDELSELANIEHIPPVQISLFQYTFMKSIRDFANFRKFAYRIKNDEEFDTIELAS